MEINLLKYNRHWEKGLLYPYPKKRFIFKDLVNFVEKKFIIELVGLRRVGKSTLFFQMINHLKKEKRVNIFKILYFTFDEKQPAIEELLDSYSLQTKVDWKKETIYIFLDEIQKLPSFQNQIKIYYDLYPNIKFFISGSTSLFIKKKTQESLAGRTKSFIIKPLSFAEYLYFKDKSEMIKKPLLYQKELEKELKTFFTSQFIESIGLNNQDEKKDYFTSIIKKIVFEDLPSIFSFDSPTILFKIVQHLAQHPGAIVNLVNLSQDLKVSNKTLSLYLSYLEDAFLIKKFYNFSRSLTSSEKRLKKYYLASPSFSFALTDFLEPSCLFENYFASLTDASYFWRNPYKNEVDFIEIDGKNQIIPIEIKFEKEIKEKELNNLILFMKKYQTGQGKVFYRGIDKKTIILNKNRLSFIPFYVSL